MLSDQQIVVDDDTQVGQARRVVTEICRRHGAEEVVAAEAGIIVTELATNVVRHGGGGQILVKEFPRASKFRLELTAIDRGSGIPNVGQALRDGYSTNGTAGTGLGSINRLSSRLEIYSQSHKGTVVWATVGEAEAPTNSLEINGISVALKGETVCGDAWDTEQSPDGLRLMVADGLGHGPFAEEAAREATAVFRKHRTSSPAAIMEFSHLALGKTRGAAGASVHISPEKKQITSSGIGNISMRLCDYEQEKTLISDNGTLGGNARRAQESRVPWSADTILVMHSDGLSAQWSLTDYPGLFAKPPAVIAAVLYRDFRRERDDATVVVVKERK